MTRKQIKEQAARYAKFVEWSDEDQCFIGRCPEIMGGGVHGSDEARVYAELCQAVEEMLELIHADGLNSFCIKTLVRGSVPVLTGTGGKIKP